MFQLLIHLLDSLESQILVTETFNHQLAQDMFLNAKKITQKDTSYSCLETPSQVVATNAVVRSPLSDITKDMSNYTNNHTTPSSNTRHVSKFKENIIQNRCYPSLKTPTQVVSTNQRIIGPMDIMRETPNYSKNNTRLSSNTRRMSTRSTSSTTNPTCLSSHQTRDVLNKDMDHSMASQRRLYRKNYLDTRKYKDLCFPELRQPEVIINEFVAY
ncbi:hypothetical protein HanXRQr2_Chr02g0060081 [Helianthus annuus]|uniref:Uncharacterized protein n=1 Tax=Helianthus annuus TaxID=4232 RepID=A0A251VF75_HELAN|nr:hypothetical protein HanXRQr2_Chr02g0060081 [Helianthus annuus]